MHEYTRVNAKVNYIRGRTRRNGCSSNNFILLCKRSQQNEIIIIINGTEVFGQMRKLWRLAERKGETCRGLRNGQSNRIWDRSGGGTGYGTDCRTRLLRKVLSTLVKGLQNLPIIAVGEEGQKIPFLNALQTYEWKSKENKYWKDISGHYYLVMEK